MNGGLVRIREQLHQLNPSERIAAEYILQHPQEIIALSTAQLAQASGASQAAIIRLCKSIGVKGYQELKLKVAGDLQGEEHEAKGYQEFHPDDSIGQIIQNVSNNNIQSIRDTLKILDVSEVVRAVKALGEAERIFLFGVAASNLIAQDLQQKFLRINKTCFAFPDSHLQMISAVTLTERDAALGISYSGETRVVIESLRHARDSGATTISVTKYGSNPLIEYSDIPLFTSSTENEIRSGATSSRITQLNVIDILYLGVASQRYEQSVDLLEKTRAAIKNLESGSPSNH